MSNNQHGIRNAAMTRRHSLLGSAALTATWIGGSLIATGANAQSTSTAEARAIAKEAYIYVVFDSNPMESSV
jgi:hypothetical protein